MKGHWKRQLEHELAQAGATDKEISGLVPLAAGLRTLKTAKPGAEGERLRPKRWTMLLRPALMTASGAAVGMAIVMFSQSAAPTSWLYPVQELSDRTAIMIHPEYRAAVMMRRARQVNELVAGKARPATIKTVLASYDKEAASYRSMPRASYAAFEYCQANLKQAASAAPVGVRQAILDSLESLNTT